MSKETVTNAFLLLADLAEAMGVAPLNKLAGLWEPELDGSWWIAVNPQTRPMQSSHGTFVPPFHCYVEFNGWPAGLFSPHNGTIAAGALANEHAFIEAVQKKIQIEQNRKRSA